MSNRVPMTLRRTLYAGPSPPLPFSAQPDNLHPRSRLSLSISPPSWPAAAGVLYFFLSFFALFHCVFRIMNIRSGAHDGGQTDADADVPGRLATTYYIYQRYFGQGLERETAEAAAAGSSGPLLSRPGWALESHWAVNLKTGPAAIRNGLESSSF